jgi:hypothetical protein
MKTKPSPRTDPTPGRLRSVLERYLATQEAKRRFEREHVKNLLHVGFALGRQKERLGHGEWLPWLRENFSGVSLSQVHLMMRAAEAWETSGKDAAVFAGDCTWTELLRKHGLK